MRRLTRRDLLKTGGGLVACGVLAGCTGDGRYRQYQAINDPSPPELGATLTADVTEPLTHDHPITIRVRFVCEAERPTDYAIEGPGSFPFGRGQTAARAPETRGGTDRRVERLVLDSRDNRAWWDDGCWKYADTGSEANDVQTDPVTLAPGETVEVDRVLVNHEQNESCYPLGEYRFSETYWRGTDVADREDRTAIQWGFSVSVTGLLPEVEEEP